MSYYIVLYFGNNNIAYLTKYTSKSTHLISFSANATDGEVFSTYEEAEMKLQQIQRNILTTPLANVKLLIIKESNEKQ